jgi:hypothetical protein
MRIYTQLALFISSYTPLLIIIILEYYQSYLKFSLIVLVIVIIVNGFLLGYLGGIVKGRSNRDFKVKTSENKTSDTLNYLLPYVIALVGLKLTSITDILILGILLAVVFVVYIHSNLLLMNPLLNALGFKFYNLEVDPKDKIIVISKKHLKADITIKTKRISKGLYLLEDS